MAEEWKHVPYDKSSSKKEASSEKVMIQEDKKLEINYHKPIKSPNKYSLTEQDKLV